MELYKINEAIEDLIDYETGEITDVEAWKQLQIDREEKLTNIALLYLNRRQDAEAFAKLEKMFKAKKESAQKTMKWCKEVLDMELNGEKMRDKERRFNIYYSPSSSVQYTDEKAIPSKWISTKTVIDKAGIKKELEAGNDVAGAVLVTKQNIQIR